MVNENNYFLVKRLNEMLRNRKKISRYVVMTSYDSMSLIFIETHRHSRKNIGSLETMWL